MADFEALRKTFKDYLIIGMDNLEWEVQHQADLSQNVSEELAKAISRRDAAEDDLDELEATLALSFRASAKDGATDAKVKAMVKIDPGRKVKFKEVIRLREQAAILQGMVFSYVQRSEMVVQACRLFLKDYYGNLENKADSSYKQLREKSAMARTKL
jgi:hypothetical protein